MQTKSKLFVIKWNMNLTESWKDGPRLCSTSALTHAQNIPTREQLRNSNPASACLSGLLGKKDKMCKLTTEDAKQTAKYCPTAPKKKNFILQPRAVNERIRSLEHLYQWLLLLEVRHRLITALNNLLRPSRNLESAAPSLWRPYISRAGDQHEVLQVALWDIPFSVPTLSTLVLPGSAGAYPSWLLKAINIRNVCIDVQLSSTWKLDVMEM